MAAAAPDDEEEAKHRYQADRLMFQLDQWMSSRKERLQDAFHAFDSDGNGTLDFGEVCKMADRLQITASVPEVRILFDSIDVDGSGSISLVKLDHHLRKWRQSAGDHRQEAPVTPPRSLGAWKRQTVETVGEVFSWTPSEVAKQRAVTKAVAVTTFNEAGRKRSREVAKENRVAALMAGMGDSIKKEGKIKDQEEEAALQQKLRSQLLGNAAVKGWAIQHAAAPGDAGGEMNATFTSVETEKEDDESAVMRELEEMMKSGYKRISDTFREIDQDGNGMLDFGELCAAMSALDVNLTLGQMRSLFDSLDDDDSGGVTCDELEAHIRRWRLSAALASGGRDASGKVRGGAAAGDRGSNKTRLIRRAPGGTTFKPLVVKPAPQVDPKKEKAKAEWARIRAEASLRTGERRGGQLHGHSGDRHGKARERKAKCLWDGSGEAGLDDKMTARLVRTLERQRVDAAKMRMARRLEEARAAAALATHAVTFQNERPGGDGGGGGGGGGGDHGQREVPETTSGGGGGQGNDDGDSDGDGDLTVSPVRRTSSMPLRDPPTGRSSVTSASGSSSSNTGLLSRNSPFGRQSSMHGLTATAAASAAAASPSTRPPPPSSAHTMAVLAKASSAPTLLAKHTGTWGPYGTSSDGRAQGLPAWSCCMQDQEDAPGCVPCGPPPGGQRECAAAVGPGVVVIFFVFLWRFHQDAAPDTAAANEDHGGGNTEKWGASAAVGRPGELRAVKPLAAAAAAAAAAATATAKKALDPARVRWCPVD
eukprot:g1966.t1